MTAKRRVYWAMGLVGLIVPWTIGCSRTLIVAKDYVINTAVPVDYDRPPAEREGETVELVILCVTPDDWGKGGNSKLIPDNPLTATEYFKDESTFHGAKKKVKIVGMKHDGKNCITIRDIAFPIKELFDQQSAIWVWAKFTGPDRQVLPVPAVVYHPPGHYTDTLRVRVGANEKLEGDAKGQYLVKDTKK